MGENIYIYIYTLISQQDMLPRWWNAHYLNFKYFLEFLQKSVRLNHQIEKLELWTEPHEVVRFGSPTKCRENEEKDQTFGLSIKFFSPTRDERPDPLSGHVYLHNVVSNICMIYLIYLDQSRKKSWQKAIILDPMEGQPLWGPIFNKYGVFYKLRMVNFF